VLIDNITEEIEQVKMQIEPCKSKGYYTLSLATSQSKKYVFSKYNPQRDVLVTVDPQKHNKETIWILLGYGMGYLAEEITRQTHGEVRIIVVEPVEGYLKEQMALDDKQILVKNKNFNLFSGTNFLDFKALLTQNITMQDAYNVEILSNVTYLEFYPKYFNEIVNTLKEYLQLLIINYNTISRFAPSHLQNILRNRKAIIESNDINVYRNQYRNIPAVIVSAGPSLEKNISLIKDFKGIIITGGRTLTNVLDQGIKPHFLVSMDPGKEAYWVLRQNAKNDMHLISPASGHFEVVANNSGQKFFVEETFNEYAYKLLNLELPRLKMGGSVATLCLSAVHHMGCNPIIFIGQDLAVTGLKNHIDETEVIDQNKEKLVYIEGYDGEPVPTKIEYIIFLRWIEDFVSIYGDREYINATEGGAHIKGTEQFTFEEVIKKYNEVYDIKNADTKLFRSNNVEEHLEKLLMDLKECIAVSKTGVKLASDLQQEYNQHGGKRQVKINQLIQQLDSKVDNKLKHTTSLVNGIFLGHYMAEEMNLEFKMPLQETPLQEGRRIARKSLKLYEEVRDSLIKVVEVIETNI
jgi:hypothetical protein